jgi:curved DNA-binding protein CbpA
MNENLAYKVNSSFNLLGLKPGADSRQIRSAFRRLARIHHPDIAGAFNTRKYEQISKAYLLLKNLTSEELFLLEAQFAPKRPENKIRKESFFTRWKRKREDKEAAREEELRAARETEEMIKEARERAISDRIDSILDRCVEKMKSTCKRKQNEKLNQEVSDIIIRLEASRYEVRLMAMQNISKYANIQQVKEALLNTLSKYPITGEMLDSINKLQLPHEFMQKIISIISGNIGNLEEHEALPFVRKIIFMIAGDKNIISRLMEHPSLKLTEFLIARWTFPVLPSEVVLKRIFLDVQNEKLIISTLSMLKKYDKRVFPCWLIQKMNELSAHDNASIRLWVRSVLTNENMVK